MPVFENTYWLLGLLLLLPLGAVFVLAIRRKQAIRKQLGDSRLVQQLTATYNPTGFRLKFLLAVIALALAILAAANLRREKPGGSTDVKAGVDIMLAIDVSKSMLSEDVKPNRLMAARQIAQQLISGAGNNRVGLIVFAGEAFLQLPVTADATAARLLLSNIEPNMAPLQGTALGSALLLCNNSLQIKEKKYKTVVLITDGEDHDSEVPDAIKTLHDAGVVVHTIGVGSPQGATIKEPGINEPKVDDEGQTIVTRLNEKILQQIAGDTGGTYQRLDNNSSTVAGNILSSIGNMEKMAITGAGGSREYTTYFPYFLAMAFLLLVAEIFVSEKKKPARPAAIR